MWSTRGFWEKKTWIANLVIVYRKCVANETRNTETPKLETLKNSKFETQSETQNSTLETLKLEVKLETWSETWNLKHWN